MQEKLFEFLHLILLAIWDYVKTSLILPFKLLTHAGILHIIEEFFTRFYLIIYSLPKTLSDNPRTAIALAGFTSSPRTMMVERQITKTMTKDFMI